MIGWMIASLTACGPGVTPEGEVGGGPRLRPLTPPSETSASTGTTEPGTVESSGNASVTDPRCGWMATVAAGQDLVVEASTDGVVAHTYGMAYVMTLTTEQVLAQCEVGPHFGTDDWLWEAEGHEGEGKEMFGLGVVPAIVSGDLLRDDGAVMLAFFEPLGGSAILLPSAASVVHDVAFDYLPSDLEGTE